MILFKKKHFLQAIQNNDVEALKKLTNHPQFDVNIRYPRLVQDEGDHSDITVWENGLSLALCAGSLDAFEYLLTKTNIFQRNVYYEEGEKTTYRYDEGRSRIAITEHYSRVVSLAELPEFLLNKSPTPENHKIAVAMCHVLIHFGIYPRIKSTDLLEFILKNRGPYYSATESEASKKVIYQMRQDLIQRQLVQYQQSLCPLKKVLKRPDLGLLLGDIQLLTQSLYPTEDSTRSTSSLDMAYQTVEFLYSAWQKRADFDPSRDYPLFIAAFFSGFKDKLSSQKQAADLRLQLTSVVGQRLASEAILIIQKADKAKNDKQILNLSPTSALLLMAMETATLFRQACQHVSKQTASVLPELQKGAHRVRLCTQMLASNTELPSGTKALSKELFELYNRTHLFYNIQREKVPVTCPMAHPNLSTWLTRHQEHTR